MSKAKTDLAAIPADVVNRYTAMDFQPDDVPFLAETAELVTRFRVDSVKIAAEIGRRLKLIRDEMPHGGWTPYLASLNISQSTAYNYIYAHEVLSQAPQLGPAVDAGNIQPNVIYKLATGSQVNREVVDLVAEWGKEREIDARALQDAIELRGNKPAPKAPKEREPDPAPWLNAMDEGEAVLAAEHAVDLLTPIADDAVKYYGLGEMEALMHRGFKGWLREITDPLQTPGDAFSESVRRALTAFYLIAANGGDAIPLQHKDDAPARVWPDGTPIAYDAEEGAPF